MKKSQTDRQTELEIRTQISRIDHNERAGRKRERRKKKLERIDERRKKEERRMGKKREEFQQKN